MAEINLIAELSKEFITGSTEVVDIVTFVESDWGLQIKLLPVQKFILKCFYGLPLDDGEKTIDVPDVINERILYSFNEREFLTWLYAEGRCNFEYTEGHIFQELILSIGRRGTKSTLSSCIGNYEMYKLLKYGDPSKHYGFPPFTKLAVLNVATNDEQSKVVFDMTQSFATNCSYMKDRILNPTKTYFNLQTDADIRSSNLKSRASLTFEAGGCASASLRGRNAIVVIMDEFAHFIDNNGRFSGNEVYNALSPSAFATFRRDGKVILISSPYAKYGKFFEKFIDSFEDPEITLTFKMYSAMVNPMIPTEILKAARKEDRTAFMCEYGGEFSDTITAWIEDEDEFKKCVTSRPVVTRGVGDIAYYYGIDIGFKNDGSSVAIVHKDYESKKIILDSADVWFSGSSDVWEMRNSLYSECNKYAMNDLLKMSDLVKEVELLLKWFPAKEGVFDQNNGYALAELFQANGLFQFKVENFTETTNSEVYQLVKRLYSEELLDLFNHPILIPEMLTLEGEKRSKSKIIVRAPTRKGAHDDISDAYCRAVWKCYNDLKERPSRRTSRSRNNFNRSQTVETQAMFNLRKLRQHGVHPRGLYNLRNSSKFNLER